MPNKQPMSNRDFFLMMIPVVIALLVVAFTIGLYLSQRVAGRDDIEDKQETENEVVDDVVSDDENENNTDTDTDEVVGIAEKLNIAWQTPEEITPSKSFEDFIYKAGMVPEIMGDGVRSSERSLVGAHKLGVIQGGVYDGYILTNQVVKDTYDMGGPYYYYHYVLMPNDLRKKMVLLEKYYEYTGAYGSAFLGRQFDTPSLPSGIENIFTIDRASIISEFEGKDITLPNGTILSKLSTGFMKEASYFVDYENKPIPFGTTDDTLTATVQGMNIYRRLTSSSEYDGISRELFYTIRHDGRLAWHDMKLNFWSVDAIEAQDIKVVTNGVSVHTGNYMKAMPGGCGYMNLTTISTLPEDATKISFLGNIGNTPVYELTASGLAEFRDQAESWLGYNDGKTIDDYIALKPYLYVKDGIGRWIQLSNTRVMSGAECGKPVIYLYPEKKTDVLVKVDPKGGFTKVEPAYNDGWRVTALPSGKLKNKDDGKMYPYLFWEGHGGLYSEPQNYWVMKQKDIHRELPKLLVRLGLNRKEARDFMEFWGPRMKSAPYYKIGFHGNMVMNELAPLAVTPAPTSVLRILMDYTELQEPIPANPPAFIPGFDRNGFTVVEWGGVLRGE